MRRRRKLIAATVFLLALNAALATASEPGDKVLAIDNFNADLATDKCPGGSLATAVEGAPGSPDDYGIYIGSGYSTCTERTRFVGVTGDGRRFRTAWRYARKGEEASLGVEGAYRCWIAFAVKRRDHTFFTKRVRPEDPETDNCPPG
jgi:hypothetical protein